MKFLINRASDFFCDKGKPTGNSILLREKNKYKSIDALYGIEMNSLDELISFQKEQKCGIIIEDVNEDDFPEYKQQITIYDYNIE